MSELPDRDARLRALTDHAATLLVEAGAGSGKTAIMAGRVVLMLAAGVRPAAIAAISFTELAAGELLGRITAYLDALLAGEVPVGLEIAVGSDLSPRQREHLQRARLAIGELTCTTIHGFCQALIRPYPVEAAMDPGARVMDATEAELAYRDQLRLLLRQRLDRDEADGALAAFVLAAGEQAQRRIDDIARFRLHHRSASVAPAGDVMAALAATERAVAAFADWLESQAVEEAGTAALAVELTAAAGDWRNALGGRTEPELAGLMRCAVDPPSCAALTQQNRWRRWGRKGKWQAAAQAAGLAKADGGRLSAEGERLYQGVGEAWLGLMGAADAAAFAALAGEFDALLARFADYKRAAALLDFDDLLIKARDLLRGNAAVRRALAGRYRHVLVDEFQDTDPLQAEILWLLAGEGPDGVPWWERRLRPGALFCVGDPKQAIYRFRGADVDTYLQARQAVGQHAPENILAVTANFRSLAPLLEWLNERFEAPLSLPGQPGFARLAATAAAAGERPAVVGLDIEGVEDPASNRNALRDAEARAVAHLCQQLIGNLRLRRRRGDARLRPGDIALIAPAGTQLWRYELALENLGIPVASQAGKGFFRRQEVQDLIAVARVLADGRDTAALGALLRGPLVGLTEEALLDVVNALPPSADFTGLPRLHLWTPPAEVADPLCREVLEILQTLARGAPATTPFELLAAAVERLQVRPMLRQRHPGGAERALANVDRFLGMAQPYSVRGLRAFSADMRRRWEDADSEVEGWPDAGGEAVQLITMHSAKGLEWPVVVPINTVTRSQALHGIMHERATDAAYGRIGPVPHPAYEAVREAESAQREREQLRLLYVTCTRAEELLVLPRLGEHSFWFKPLAPAIDELPDLDIGSRVGALVAEGGERGNAQDAAVFAEEGRRIWRESRRLTWVQPSRHEAGAPPTLEEQVFVAGEASAARVLGSARRGTLLHKLLEEVLRGETGEHGAVLEARARSLMHQLDLSDAEDPLQGVSSSELAATVLRALSLEQVVSLRGRLQPEVTVYGHRHGEDGETVTVGVVDALARGADGAVEVVVDWKSDVDPGEQQRRHYRSQVREYMALTGAARGLIVYATTGAVETLSAGDD